MAASFCTVRIFSTLFWILLLMSKIMIYSVVQTTVIGSQSWRLLVKAGFVTLIHWISFICRKCDWVYLLDVDAILIIPPLPQRKQNPFSLFLSIWNSRKMILRVSGGVLRAAAIFLNLNYWQFKLKISEGMLCIIQFPVCVQF